MEMRFRHWIGITVVACSFLAVTSLPPDPIRPRYRPQRLVTAERDAVVRLERQLSTAQFMLHIAERRDVAMAEITAADSDEAPPFLASDELPGGVREILEEKVRDATEGLQLEGGPLRATLTARVRSSSTDWWSYGSTLHLLPSATDGRTCVTMYDLGPGSIRLLDDGTPAQAVVANTLRYGWGSRGMPLARGPCAFFARFGLPGPHVEAWLEESEYAFARLADWDRPERRELPDQGIRVQLRLPRVYGLSSARSLNALACMAGRADRCRDALSAPAPAVSYYNSDRLRARRDAGWLTGNAPYGVLGSPTSHFLSDVVREVGPERFTDFWTSDLPVEQAFASVVGRDIGEWTAGWLAGSVGRQHFGPGVGFGGILMVALFAGLGVFAGAYVAEKRKAG